MINLDTKVWEYFGVKQIPGLKFGVELEYENARLQDFSSTKTPLTRWKLEKDDSLRNNGIEFVSRPTSMDKMDVTIEQMLTAAKSIGCVATPRCGLHVHVNMTDKSFRELFNLAVYYTLLEPVLFSEYAEGRQDSHFCVPTYSNTVLVEHLMDDMQKLRRGINLSRKPKRKTRPAKLNAPQYIPSQQFTKGMSHAQLMNTVQKLRGGPKPIMFTNDDFGNMPIAAQQAAPVEEAGIEPGPCPAEFHPPPLQFCTVPKYAALNFGALKKFGTLEYRQHPSTMAKGRLIEWIGIINNIHEAAAAFRDPLDILNLYDADGLSHMCEKVGLKQTQEVDKYDLEDAVDAATMIAGHEPVSWKNLEWEIA